MTVMSGRADASPLVRPCVLTGLGQCNVTVVAQLGVMKVEVAILVGVPCGAQQGVATRQCKHGWDVDALRVEPMWNASISRLDSCVRFLRFLRNSEWAARFLCERG